MKLGGIAIRELFTKGTWKVRKFGRLVEPEALMPLINPNSINITLHPKLLISKLRDQGANASLELDDPDALAWHEYDMSKGRVWNSLHGPDRIIETGFLLRPGEFVLGAAAEAIDCTAPYFHREHGGITDRKFVQMYEGRSTCARIGLASHITAGFGDYGFAGAFTLEIVNHADYAIHLIPGMRIGQVAFEEVLEPELYQGAYSGQHHDGPVPPKLGKDRF